MSWISSVTTFYEHKSAHVTDVFRYCGIFTDFVHSWNCTVLVSSMISQLWIVKNLEGNSHSIIWGNVAVSARKLEYRKIRRWIWQCSGVWHLGQYVLTFQKKLEPPSSGGFIQLPELWWQKVALKRLLISTSHSYEDSYTMTNGGAQVERELSFHSTCAPDGHLLRGRYQMLHQYSSTSWWCAYNARNM